MSNIPLYEEIEKRIDKTIAESSIPKCICDNNFDLLINNEKNKYRIMPKTELEKKLESESALAEEIRRMIKEIELENWIDMMTRINQGFLDQLKKNLKRN